MYKKTAPETIQAMFASIAPNYDKANAAFTFGLHKVWNHQMIQLLQGAEKLLDLCAGTGVISFDFLKKNPKSEAILLDFCPEMLQIAGQKGKAFQGRFEMLQADAQDIPLPNLAVDAVSIAYGIRNVANPARCFSEAFRVLKPQGRFVILEATRPHSWALRKAHGLYTGYILPLLGKIMAKNGDAYKYLATSVENFATPAQLEKLLREAGFKKVEKIPLMGGVTTLFIAYPLGD